LLKSTPAIQEMILDNMNSSFLKQNTKRNHYKALRKIFDYAVEWGYMTLNPLPKSLMPKEIVGEIVVLQDGETKRIIEYFIQEAKKYEELSRAANMYRYSYKTKFELMAEMANLVEFLSIVGSRISETVNLKWEQISQEKIKIHGKGSYNREFPIKPFPELESLLQRMNAVRKTEYLFSWERPQKPTAQIKKAIEALKIDTKGHYGFHIIRKTRINEFVENYRMPFVVVAELSGHSKAVLEKYYIAVYGAEKTAEILRKAGYGSETG
jgi:integrase